MVHERWLKDLNPEQAEVVRTLEGPIVVLAGAGTGKTAALIRRVGALSDVTDTSSILAVTFNKKAAEQMAVRAKRLGIPIEKGFSRGVQFSTWHSLCYRIVQEWRPLLRKDYGLDKKKYKFALDNAARRIRWDEAKLGDLLQFTSVCKANGLLPADAKVKEIAVNTFGRYSGPKAAEVYRLAEIERHEQRFFDFDDMLLDAYLLLRDDPIIREGCQRRWKYLLQDEAQDASPVQIYIADFLAGTHRNYMMVGDPAQCIYKFRGAEPQFLLDFPKRYDAKVVCLHRNYRSGARILEVANTAVSRASWRLPEELAAQRSIKGHVDVLDYDTFSDAADAAAERVKEIVAEGGNYKDFVVIYRTNVQSRPYEQAFFEAKIPFVVKSGYSFYDRAEVRNLLAYLRVAFGLDQTIASIGYCINTPSRFLGKVFTGHVKDLKIDEPSLTWGEAVRAVAQSKDLGLKARQRDKAVEFYLVLKALGESKLDVQPLLRWLVQKLDYLEEVDKKVADIEDADNYPSHNVLELINVAGQFKDVKSFLAFVDEQIDIAHRFAKDEEPDAVVLATIHRVKGLEFKEVWFTGCQKGILPHVKSANPMDEELRLFYVGVTRAKDVLSCVWVRESPAYVKSQKGSNENAIGGPSPFLYSSGLLEYPPTPEPQPTTANLRPA